MFYVSRVLKTARRDRNRIDYCKKHGWEVQFWSPRQNRTSHQCFQHCVFSIVFQAVCFGKSNFPTVGNEPGAPTVWRFNFGARGKIEPPNRDFSIVCLALCCQQCVFGIVFLASCFLAPMVWRFNFEEGWNQTVGNVHWAPTVYRTSEPWGTCLALPRFGGSNLNPRQSRTSKPWGTCFGLPRFGD